MKYLDEEDFLVRKCFNLEEIIQFTKEQDVQLIRGEDWQYVCYIDKKGYAPCLSPLMALTIGVRQFKENA